MKNTSRRSAKEAVKYNSNRLVVKLSNGNRGNAEKGVVV
jgi:hypothetical protein